MIFFQIEAALSFFILYLQKNPNLSCPAIFERALALFFLEEIMQVLRGTCPSPSQGEDTAPSRMCL